MVLRFYRRGPVAVRGNLFWVTADGKWGCTIASGVGVHIPVSTYLNADPDAAQWGHDDVGFNFTALLPIEE